LRAWGGVCRSPPSACRHLPLRWGDRQASCYPLYPQLSRWPRPLHESISPPEGEMSGRTEGGKPHPQTSRCVSKNLSNKNTSQPNQTLTRKSAKNTKNPPATFSMTRESPAQLSRSALGYTARRCGEAGPALVGERLRILFAIGVEQQSPRRHGRRTTPVSDRPVSSSRCPTWPHRGCRD
jgi:hypothetical protein